MAGSMFDLVAELRGFAEGNTSARATLMRDAADTIEALLTGTYEAYRQLGEDTDGARNARELFGPMTNLGNPAAWVARLIAEHRAEAEDRILELEQMNSRSARYLDQAGLLDSHGNLIQNHESGSTR